MSLNGQQRALVPRTRLVDLVADAGLVLVEAPGGYGKTTLVNAIVEAADLPRIRLDLRQPTTVSGLIAHLARALRRAGHPMAGEAAEPDDPEATLDAVAGALAAGEPVVLTVDDAQWLEFEAAGWWAELIERLPPESRAVVAGRSLADDLRFLGATIGARVDEDDLRFDRDEVCQLLALREEAGPDAAARADAILADTGGWPAAVVVAADAGPSDGDRAASPAGILRALVRRLLERADPAVLPLAGVAARLPLVSEDLFDALGHPGGLGRLRSAGLPVRLRADGWSELPDAIREAVQAPPPDSAEIRLAAAAYCRAGEVAEGLTLLIRNDDAAAALPLLAAESRQALRHGLPLCDQVVTLVSDEELAEVPDALVALVRAAERSAHHRDPWIVRATAVFAGDSPAGRAVAAEAALATARSGELETALAEAEGLLAIVPSTESLTRGRALLVRAYCLIVADTAESTGQAAEDLETALAAFRSAGDRGWEAEAHQLIGFGCLFTAGATDAAIERLERALTLRSAPDADRAQTLTYLAEVLIQMGRLDDAAVALQESTGIARRLGDDKSIAYAAWSTADLAAERGDRATALAALDEVAAHPAGWFDTLAGIDFLQHAAQIRLRLGDAEGARIDLERAEERASGTAREGTPLLAWARYETVVGDPQLALRHLDEMETSPVSQRGERWLRALLRAVVLTRLGDLDGARDQHRQAERLVAEEGDPDRLARLEPHLLQLIEGSPDDPQPASVTMLGGFAVTRAGEDATPPPGLPSTLVKVLALRGRLTVDQAVDLLWPDADLATGRSRLRNLLNRVRSASGDLVVRTDAGLTLAADVRIDAAGFEEAADEALRAAGAERVSRVRGALERWSGELLPDDRYADWADVPRERVRRRYLDLLDVLTEDALARGDLAEAVQLLDAAIAHDPLEEIRYVRLADAYLRQRRSRSAADIVARGQVALEQVGLPPSAELAMLAASL